MTNSLDTDYVIGLSMVDRRMVMLVDIDRLTPGSELMPIEKLAA